MQRIAHSLWHLIDKAEHTMVFAAFDRAHQPAFKVQPKRLVEFLFNIGINGFTLRRFKAKLQSFFCGELFIIDHIQYFFSVNGCKRPTRLYAKFLRD